MTLSFEKRDKLIYISNKVMRKKALSICILSIIFSSTAYSQQDRERVTVPTKLQDYREKEISELATHQLNRRYSPLSDSQSKELKERNEDRERMINESVREPAPQSRTILINPKMVDKDNVIYASANYQTTIVFVDRFGKPWDITNKGIGAEPFFDISQYEPHSITVNPLRKYVKTNLTIMLKSLLLDIYQ